MPFPPVHTTPRPAPRLHCEICGAVLSWADTLPIRWVCPRPEQHPTTEETTP